MRSNIQDDYDKASMENAILVRLNLTQHPNIVRQISFYKDLSKQTTQLVMEALNGLTLTEILLPDPVPEPITPCKQPACIEEEKSKQEESKLAATPLGASNRISVGSATIDYVRSR